jgi:uncharacterized membrane protein YoaK (UPF0700 family)
MFTKNKDLIYLPANLFIWFLLAFQGGLLNAGGYLAVHRFVSHVTGFATLFGVDAVTKDWGSAFGMLFGPLFYLLGTIISAWFIERERIRAREPKYKIVFFLIIFNLIFLSIFGNLGYLGNFGEEFHYGRDYVVLFILALTCGLQNAVISSASGAVIRTTHLTGPTTDFGIGLVRLWTERKNKNKDLIFANWCRAGIICSFIIGSLVGAYLYSQFTFLGFLFPAFTSFYVMIRLGIHKSV